MDQIPLDALNRFVIHKQHLTADSQIDDVVRIVSDIGGLHATSATTPYLSLLARSRQFAHANLDRELYVKKTLGKIRCMRKTVYILTQEMLPIAYQATAQMVEQNSRQYLEFRGVTSKEYTRVSKAIVELLRGNEMTTAEIKKALKRDADVSSIVNLMCDRGLVIRARPSKSWRDTNHHYVLFSENFPHLDLLSVDEGEAVTRLVEHYLSAFGPATEEDITWWTGLGKTKVRAALAGLRTRTITVRALGISSDMIMLGSQARRLAHVRPLRQPTVSLLPTLDPYLMGYKERERYLDGAFSDRVFDRTGNAAATILLNGRVVGVWDFSSSEAVLKFHLLDRVAREVLLEIHRLAYRVGHFIAQSDVRILECKTMVPLTKRPAGAVLSPLKDT